MIHPLRRAVLAAVPFSQHGSRMLTSFSAVGSLEASRDGGLMQRMARTEPVLHLIPSRNIHYWEREYKEVLAARKKKEMAANPERYTRPNPRYAFAEWNYKAELYAFGKRLGEEFDDGLLREALTDQSYIHTEREKQEKLGIDTSALEIKNNQELSELGAQVTKDALLQFFQKEIPQFPAEGHNALSKHLTSQQTLTEIATNLGFKDIILCAEYPPSEETYARSFLAIVGALQKSSGDERVEKFVIDFVASLLCGKDINEIWDVARPWHMMVDIAKQKGLYPVEPRLIREAGRNTIHAVYVVGVYDKDKQLLGKGIGETLDIAQEMAARDVLKEFFKTKDPMPPFEFQSANFPYKLVPHVRNIHK
ncbi:39S ribosomal protein L44, mitochondrial [Orchesella cincta]|uniref:Large ribosomal subunit protein mL44 n=1 Tax=Orchesella cincta TaxID=48709 RepID=A0A1D2MY72_ORCCI|nr:39S ribosomal protein L44, mitochondrial [Orchesella cincta]